MIAPEYFNNHVAVEGEIIVKSVPNDAGFVLVWNPTTKKISRRTHTELISDLNLVTSNQLGNYWQKYDNGSYRGIDDDSGANFSFLTNGGVTAKKINTGGLLTSDEYSDQQYIPANGIYSKGNIATLNYGSAIDWAIAYNWTQTQGATMNWVNANFVTLNTNQVIIANKYFSPISAVEFLGSDLNHVKVFRKTTGDIGVVSGHEYVHYNTNWLVGNKRGGSDNSLGLSFQLSDDAGATYDEKVLIQPDGNILTSNFGSANLWNAKVDQSQLSGYVRTTGDQNIDGIKGFTGAYTQWILNGDPANARGFVQSASGGFLAGTLNDNHVVFYRNSIEKIVVEDLLTTFRTNISVPNAIQNDHAVNLGQLNSQMGNYLPLSGGTLTSGGKIDARGNIYVQQGEVGGSATGMFWQSIDDTQNISGIGTLTVNGGFEYMYMGWGSTPWEVSTSFSVNSDIIQYKGNVMWHAGNLPDYRNYGLGRSQEGATNYNLNDIAETSILGINDNTTSRPAGLDYGSVWTHRKSPNEFTQIAVDVITGQSYTRGLSGHMDIGWRKGWDNVNLQNPVDQSQLSGYVSKSGDTMTGALDINASNNHLQFSENGVLKWHMESLGGEFNIVESGVAQRLRISPNASTPTYNGYGLWHAGNLDPVTRNTAQQITGKKEFVGATGNDYNGAGIMINGNGSTIYPTLAFHQPGFYAGTVSYRDNEFYFMNINGNGFDYVRTAGFIKEGSSNDYLLLGGGSHKPVSDFATSADLSNVVTIHTPQTIIADKTFAPTSQVSFLGNEDNQVDVWKTSSGVNTVVSGHVYHFYNTRWKVGSKRDGSDGSEGYAFQFSSNGGATYDEKVLFTYDGNILTSAFGAASDWNAKVSQSQLNNYLPLSGGTLTEGGRISAQGTITIQQADTFNATGLFWETLANSDRLAGIGALTTGDTLHGVYMGWGSAPWQPEHSLSVATDYIRYKGFNVWHEGIMEDYHLYGLGSYSPNAYVNIDTPKETGFYNIYPNITSGNVPFAYANLLHMSYMGTPEFSQIVVQKGGENISFRTDSTPWRKMYHEGNFNPDNKVNKAGDTMTGGLVIDTLDAVGSNDLGVLPTNYKLFLANDNANYGTVHWVEGTGQGYIQQQRANGTPTAYRLNLQPYGGELFYGNSEVATTNYVQNIIGSRIIAENGAFALGFVGGTAVTPYVKHSNGTEVNIASQNWVNENKFVRANIPFDNSLGRNIFLSDNYFGGETGLYDKNNDHIIAGWFNNLYYYGADVNGGSNSSGIFMDYNTGHHGYRSTPNPNYFHYFNGNMQVNDNVTAQGFIKNNSSDDYFLMGGGGQLTKYSKDDSYVNSHRDFPDGTLITTNIDYSHSAGDSFLLEIKGNMYGGGIPMDTKVQGYIYADTIINQSGYSTYADLTTIIAMNINGNLCFWFPRLWYWQGFSVKVIATGGGGITTVNRVISIDNSAEPVGTKQVKIAVYTLSTQSWVNNQGFLTSANLNGYVTQSALNTQLGSYATLNGVQTFNNTNTFNQSPVIPNGTLGNHAVNLNQLLDVAPPYHWNYVGQPAITNRRVLREMTWNNYGNGHTIFDISSGTTPWGASKSNVDAEQKWTPSYPTLVGGNGSETYGVRVDSARNADNLGGIPAGNYATQTWVNTNFIPTSHPVYNITQANINSWNAGTGGGSSHTHFNLSYLNNIDQYLGTGQAPQFGSIRLMDSLGYGLLALGEDFIGGEVGLVDLSNDRFYAGRINEYLKYGSSVNGFEGLNIHFDAKLLGIGREIGNDEDKVQLAGDLSVDTIDINNNSRQLILNPLYNTDGDVRHSRNAHIYIVTREMVRLPQKPILGQRIEIFNDSDSYIEVTHDNVGTMFKIPGFCKVTGIAANKGFKFDVKPVDTKQYDI
ncbi:hypothetical protein DRF62_02005 [Chryseobacterium piscium]|uniref:Uncharacterized protein n=1 Tax=Chryseobacterium piscium TaxID=333702 RepID=A0A3D9BTV4_9FLAO|nr:hypothetical protein [Chryseobacterium piscium]REC56953.1 hypothetical protein DRF62_02005 [Chryseobacterium piscium]